jgi:N-methylhydantoinase A/oxoprolinase/acetone carboxylase beta subunit/N-methylhydantoinase B/oxoprolinase/acetone carboxylase alpha subunit
MFRIGIDVGGTFTDFVVAKDGDVPRFFKTHSTPRDPSEGVMTGLGDIAAAYGMSRDALLAETATIIHGTTVATNTLVERKGAKVGLVTTKGFRDLLEMREGLKEDRYNLHMKPMEPLVPRYLRAEVPERVRSNGAVHTPLDLDAVDGALEQLAAEGVESLAVCFLFSFLNPVHERQVAERIAARFPGMFASLSCEVLPQIKEYDRLSTTVVNSYVGPVFGRYLERLKRRIGSSGQAREVLIMQSSGGVASLDESARLAVRAVLSGPAGGVAGASAYGKLLGHAKVIAFDMGGTSTDISLVEDGAPHLTTEQFEAGWKIAVPMIDIHTLGAGGGSIARVGGGILRVGPDSAGADPGPACYAKGGAEATVSDANLVLGYLDPTNFLGGKARLNPELARKAVAERVGKPLGLETAQAAYGVHQVVSTSMAEGIRLASVRRGVDPRRFTLMAFGGAAGLHVSRVARQLGIARVSIPAAAPVFCAYGMLSTDLQFDLSRSYPASLHTADLRAIRALLRELQEQGRAKLAAQGVASADMGFAFSADMRYLDQIYEVTVPVPGLALDDGALLREWAANFHRRYEELYSYHQSGQEIRLVTLRVKATGRLTKVTLPRKATGGTADAALKGRRRIYLGEWHDVPVYDMDRLPPGATAQGPAIIESDFTTILVDIGDTATVDPYGGIELRVALERGVEGDTQHQGGASSSGKPDPVTVAVVGNRLDSIAAEMMEVMLRTAMSQILNSSRDFSTAIIDADCQLVAQGEGIPVHTSALPLAAASVRDYFGKDMAEGDLFLLNDPYFGASHLPDITVIRPVFHGGVPLYYTVNRAHHSDVGGATHGAYNPEASEIYHEGLRIPPLRIYDKGVPRRDLLQMLSANVRHPENFLGDLNAQIGSVEVAVRRIRTLLADYGPDRLGACIEELLRAAETHVRRFIAQWPEGVYKGESIIDDDGFEFKDIPIRATVTIKGGEMTVDLSESSRQVTGFLNSSYANTRSIVHAAMLYMAPSDVPKNEGSMRPVKVIAPEGLIVHGRPPAPVCMSTNHCAEEITEAIFKALAPVVPHAVTAAWGRRLRYAITGVDPRTKRRFIWHFFLARPGGGACQDFDGWSNVGELNAPGAIRAPSIEVTEERFPFFILRNEQRPNSGGKGMRRGGLGGICDLVYEGEGIAKLNTAGDGIHNPPFGQVGAGPGKPHRYSIISDGKEQVLRSKQAGVLVKPGDIIRCLSAGGGGFGDPRKRTRADREWDKKNGYTE